LFQESLRRAELLIGNALLFVPFAVAPNTLSEEPCGGLNLFHGCHAMAFVIMIGLLKRNVGLDQQIPGCGRAGNNPMTQGKGQADDRQADDRAESIISHII
jgi:hypothetical protein